MKKLLSAVLLICVLLNATILLAACNKNNKPAVKAENAPETETTYGTGGTATEKTTSASSKTGGTQTTSSGREETGTGTSKSTSAKSTGGGAADSDGNDEQQEAAAEPRDDSPEAQPAAQPEATTKPPAATRAVAATTKPPVVTARQPAATTAKPPVVTAKPPEPTRAPDPVTDPPQEGGHQKGGKHTHSISYDGNGSTGGSGRAPDSVWCEEDFLIPAETGGIFTRDGYVFIGWNTKPTGNGTMYQPDSKIYEVDDDLILYAQWALA